MKNRINILAVDDDPTNLELITEFLVDEGYQVYTAYNGKEGLEFLKKSGKEIKVIILDWMMPVMSGIEMLNELKKIKQFNNIPVIMQTAKTEKQDFIEGMKEGSYQYLTKPFDDEILLSMVDSAVEEYDRFNHLSNDAKDVVAGIREYAVSMINRQSEKLKFDLQTYKAINEFFMDSMNCENYGNLTELLMEAIKKFDFESLRKSENENGILRCSIRLAGEEEVNLSDRGVGSKLDKMILEKAMGSNQIVQRGSYTAIPSESGRVAMMIRNTPSKEEEMHKAIRIGGILLEMFEQRLIRFEHEFEIIKKNEELIKKNDQIKGVIRSCSSQLDSVNNTYQDMKEKQMEIMENLEALLLSRVPNLDLHQKAKMKEALGDQLMKSMNLYSADQITDQKFLLTIQNLKALFDQESGEKVVSKPQEMETTSQKEVDSLLASLGL